jgi:hypothetical protein
MIRKGQLQSSERGLTPRSAVLFAGRICSRLQVLSHIVDELHTAIFVPNHRDSNDLTTVVNTHRYQAVGL